MRHPFKLALPVAALAAFGPTMVQAVDFAPRAPEYPPRDYTCRFEGENVKLGDLRCLQTPKGPRTAQCVVVLNMSSWKIGTGACP